MMTNEIASTSCIIEDGINHEIRPENIPLPTDSMVTVRLSDAQFHGEPLPIEDLAEHCGLDEGQLGTHASLHSSISRTSSRNSSRSSQASSTSISVDWEGLEKTEEQEAKDDATDEVWYQGGRGEIDVLIENSPQLFCLHN